MGRFVLNPAMPVLLRPDDTVQVGWDPRRALLVHPPSGLNAAALAGLLRTIDLPAKGRASSIVIVTDSFRLVPCRRTPVLA